MANIQISGLVDAGAVVAADQFAVDNGSNVTFKVTGTEVLSFIAANVTIAESQVTNLVSDLAARATFSGSPSATNIALWSSGTNITPSAVSIDSSGNITAAHNITASGALVMTGAITGAAGTFTSVTDSGLTTGQLLTNTSGLISSSGIAVDGSQNLTLVHNITSTTGTFSAANLTATGLTDNQIIITQTGALKSSGVSIDGSKNITGVNNITGSGLFTSFQLKATSLNPNQIPWINASGILSNSGITTDGFGNIAGTLNNVIATGTITANLFQSTNFSVGNLLYAVLGNVDGNYITSTSVLSDSNGNISGVGNLLAAGTVQGGHVKATDLSSGQIVVAGASGQLTGSSNLTFSGGALSATASAGSSFLGGSTFLFSAVGSASLQNSTISPQVSGSNIILNWKDASSNVYSLVLPQQGPGPTPRVISTTTVLTAADVGRRIICRGTGPYTVTLPTAASAGANSIIYFSFEPTTFANFITLTTQGGNTIQGITPTHLTFASGESVYMSTDGTQWYIDQLNLLSANIQYYLQSVINYSIPAANQTVIWDTLGTGITSQNINYNAGTGVFTPNLLGVYEIYANLWISSQTPAYQMFFHFDGTNQRTETPANSAALLGGSAQLTDRQFFNGATDTFVAEVSAAVNFSYGTTNTQLTNYIQMWRVRNY